MRLGFLTALLFLFAIEAEAILQQPSFDKSKYYKVISSTDMNAINSQLNLLKETTFNGKEAFEGALLMKKAGLAANPKDKLELFKSGHQKLEACIKKDAENVEFRFLRLIIQENAPKILRYSSDIKNDAVKIQTSYKSLPFVVRQAIMDYSKTSKELTQEKINFGRD